MRTIRIYGYEFLVSAPYQAGSVITAGEAQALNSLRVENIQNNLRDEVKKAIGCLSEGQLLAPETIAELQAKFTKYDQGYQFLDKKLGTKPRRGVIQTEAWVIAEARVEEGLRAAGRDPAAEDPEALAALIEETAKIPAVLEAAREQAAAKAAANAGSLADLLNQ